MRIDRDVRSHEFGYRKIRALEIGKNVRTIGDRAFCECHQLRKVVFSEGLESVEGFIFQDSPLIPSISLPSTLVDIKDDSFFIGSDGILKSFDVHPENPRYCSVDGVLFTKDMKTLIQYPQNKEADSYVVPDAVETISPDAFAYARKLGSISLPEGLRKIGSGAFEWCESLESISVPDGVEGIPSYAFFCCYSLGDVVLPKRLDYLGSESFCFCNRIKEFDIPPGFDQLDYAAIAGCESLERVTIPEGIRDVNNSALMDNPRIRSIRLPQSVIAIWEKAFSRCTGLEDINIPPDVHYVSDDAFQGCESLRRVYVEGDKLEDMFWVPEGAEVVRGRPPAPTGKK